MEIFKKISIRLSIGILLFFTANYFYTKYQYQKDILRYSRVKNSIDSAFQLGDIIYMGESSNTSFNPWTDTLSESISQFLQLYLPDKKVTSITHESFHPGLFLKMLNLLPQGGKKRTVIITMNLRTCGPSAMFSGNEASNQQEALFYSNRLPLLTRIFLSLHFYDNSNEAEMNRRKFQWWRTKKINGNGFVNENATVKNWIDKNATLIKPEKSKQVADAYIKEFAFIIDENNPRVKDLDAIVRLCKNRKVDLLFHLLPESRDYAEWMFGNTLLQYMDSNAAYLYSRYTKMGIKVINNYYNSKSIQYTDQWYPTEHFNAVIRQNIAKSIAEVLSNKPVSDIVLKQNNWPNPEVKQPMADTLLKEYRK